MKCDSSHIEIPTHPLELGAWPPNSVLELKWILYCYEDVLLVRLNYEDVVKGKKPLPPISQSY